jgi:hypothetical protein
MIIALTVDIDNIPISHNFDDIAPKPFTIQVLEQSLTKLDSLYYDENDKTNSLSLRKLLETKLLKLLLVDESAATLKLHAKILTSVGLTNFKTANTTLQALDVIFNNSFDVFITDMEVNNMFVHTIIYGILECVSFLWSGWYRFGSIYSRF